MCSLKNDCSTWAERLFTRSNYAVMVMAVEAAVVRRRRRVCALRRRLSVRRGLQTRALNWVKRETALSGRTTRWELCYVSIETKHRLPLYSKFNSEDVLYYWPCWDKVNLNFFLNVNQLTRLMLATVKPGGMLSPLAHSSLFLLFHS